METTKPIIALMYDFDKTLTTKDMQEYTFIPMIHMEAQDFWNAANAFTDKYKMDSVLAYMYTMLRKADQNEVAIKRETFEECGKEIEFFPGVLDWFERINAYAAEKGAIIEHYIISSGLREIIKGSPIGDKFKEIFACEYYYDQNGVAVWPSMTVNYTGKTQYLFRINKGALNVADDKAINEATPDEERRVPFRNMIYVGDGMTDVPCMKLVKKYGGKSIAVYDETKEKSKRNAYHLLQDGRVNFCEAADYREGSSLCTRIKEIVAIMIANDHLARHTLEQVKAAIVSIEND